MRILVTGAHGYIGSHLVARLLASGHRVRALVSPWGDLSSLHAVADDPRLELRRGDITDPDAMGGATERVEAVIHAAARVGDWGAEEAFMTTNVGGTANLLAAATAAGVGRFVLVSTVAVHRYRGFRNADPAAVPRDNDAMPYARSKRAAEDLVLAWPGEGVVVRPGLWPFGPGDEHLRRVAAVLRLGLLPLVGNGERVLNTAYVGNLAVGLEAAATVPKPGARVAVIADPGMPSWSEVLGELARLLGAPAPRLRLPPSVARLAGAAVEDAWAAVAPGREPPLNRYRASLMARDVHFDPEPAMRQLGYRPQLEWREGLAATVRADPLLRRRSRRPGTV